MIDPPTAVVSQDASSIHVMLGETPFATYHLGPSEPRPYLSDVMGPHGRRITRPHPAGAGADHPHHRGVWTGHRDVDGADFWTEFAGHGRIAHRTLDELTEGPGEVRVSHSLDWLDAHGVLRLTERRSLRFHGSMPDGPRLIDVSTSLTPVDGPVRLGDTKEAGMVALRVAPSMEENNGGRVENSGGDVGEAHCWGRPAAWCDYSGQVDGEVVGVAVFDHPDNPRHPTPWHVRAYGLLAANPFGHRDFFPGQDRDGSLRLGVHEPVTFRYRLLLHLGDATAGRVADHYAEYVAERSR
ncbi:PmoA family protein [Streptomyces chromofuscus]|uniref:PmoA family protein n=1 Tax=Streptomyces chromofuscus TaxID=42881 RepID=A0A7M2TA06_STRCW|nr:PmoA family protein [Streptomyces chromofuscus]QOV44775.1 PmoA family protein [Streptomyces chromofuscus]